MANTNKLALFTSELQKLLQTMVRSYEKCDLECVKQHGLTASQASTLLSFPEKGSLTMRGLSELMGLAESTMTRAVDQIVKKNLVKRELDEEDRRVVRVSLTREGMDKRSALERALHEFFAEGFGDFEEADRAAILDALNKLMSAMEMLSGKGCCS